jgi:hypothetical protein
MNLVAAAGPWLYPLLAVAACLVLSIVRATVIIAGLDGAPHPAGPPHLPVLAWGVLAVVVGLLGTVVGFGRLALGIREETAAIRVELTTMLDMVWAGATVVLTPVALGLCLFTLSILAWLLLQFMLGRRLR